MKKQIFSRSIAPVCLKLFELHQPKTAGEYYEVQIIVFFSRRRGYSVRSVAVPGRNRLFAFIDAMACLDEASEQELGFLSLIKLLVLAKRMLGMCV